MKCLGDPSCGVIQVDSFIGDEGASVVADALRNNYTVKSLDMRGCNVRADGAGTRAPELPEWSCQQPAASRRCVSLSREVGAACATGQPSPWLDPGSCPGRSRGEQHPSDESWPRVELDRHGRKWHAAPLPGKTLQSERAHVPGNGGPTH
jgi:hypothetical protein